MGAMPDAAVIVGAVALVDQFVKLVQGWHVGDGHEVVAPNPANVAFHGAFLMSPCGSWLPVERIDVEPAFRLDALPGEASWRQALPAG